MTLPVHSAFKTLATLAIMWACVTPASGQEWEYVSYDNSRQPVLPPGSLKLIEESGKHKIRLMINSADRCYQSSLNAALVKQGDQEVITVEPLMRGCPEIRFVLQSDGSS